MCRITDTELSVDSYNITLDVDHTKSYSTDNQQKTVTTEPSTGNMITTPLDGGWGYVVVSAAFVSYFIADGWAYSFGLIFTELLNNFQESHAKTSIIGALIYAVPLTISPVICALCNLYGCRIVGIIGGFICCCAFVISSFAISLDILIFTLGIMTSVGLSMVYLSAYLSVTFYFDKRRGLAIGLAVTGSGLGAFAFPLLVEFLMNTYTWRGTLLIMGGIFLNIVVASLLFRPIKESLHQQPSSIVCNDQQPSAESNETTLDPFVSQLQEHNTNEPIDTILNPSKSQLQEHNINEPHGTMLDTSDPSLQEHVSNHNDKFQVPEVESEGNQNAESSKTRSQNNSNNNHHSDNPGEISREGEQSFSWFLKLHSELQSVIQSILNKELFKNLCYLTFCASSFMTYLWIGTLYIYLVDKVMLLGISYTRAAFLLSIIGIGRTFGQIILGFLGDQQFINTVLLYSLAIGLCGVSTLVIPLCTDYVSLSVVSLIFGFFVSSTYTLQIICLVNMFDLEQATSAFGFLQLVQGLATFLGTPLTGWMFDELNDYNPPFYVAGGMLIFSAVLLVPVFLRLRTVQGQACVTSL